MIDSTLEKGLLEAEDDFLLFLRSLMNLHDAGPNRPAKKIAEADRLDGVCDGFARAKALKLAEGPDPAEMELTPLGKQICDGVKQYCNWLSHVDELPRGVSAGMLKGRRVLDVGCGVGCALMTFGRYGATQRFGVDLMATFPRLARLLAQRRDEPIPQVILSPGTRLPFADRSFDFIFCRLVLTYLRSDDALAEMARVARPGADLVICLTTLRWDLDHFARDLKSLNVRGIGFHVLQLINGLLAHSLHVQITLPYRGKMFSSHSPVFHTPWTVRRDLRRHGFEPVSDDADAYPRVPTFHARRRPA